MNLTRKTAAKAKPTRSDRRMVRNRKALLNAAETLIAAKGFERVTIDEIAEAADLAKGTFYNYFDDKNEIAAELALTIRAEIETAVTLAQTGIDDPARRLALGLSVFLHTAVTAPNRAAVTAQMYAQWLHPEAVGNEMLRTDLADGYRLGRFSTADLPAAVVMTIGVVQAGILRALQLPDSDAVRKLALGLSGLILRSLGIKWNEAHAISAEAITRIFDK
jgi:AcrR family transcriptional regulator